MGKNRNELVRIIHIAKKTAKECPSCGTLSYDRTCKTCKSDTVPLSDDRYREILSVYGKASCRFLDDPALEKVLMVFKRAGFKPRINPEEYHRTAKAKTIAVIRTRAKLLFGVESWEPRVKGFVEKAIGKQDLWSCDDKELRKVAGWLYRYKQYRGKQSESNNKENR